MDKKITNEQFLRSIREYEEVLENGYLKEVENAEDKEYAADFFQRTLFTENEMVPYPSVLFDELRYTFEHHTKLFGVESAYEKTFVLIERVRAYAQAELHNVKLYRNGSRDVKLPGVYQEYIGLGLFNLSELILIEEQVSKYTDENLTGVLAIHIAGANLYQKYAESEADLGDISESKGSFTLNERTLAMYILLSSLGFKQGLNEDRTALAYIYHLIMDKNFNESTNVKNSNIYKALGSVPQVVKDTSKLNSYLQNIRPFFEKANMQSALDLIDENIKKDV